jgi:ATP-dependent Lon protease
VLDEIDANYRSRAVVKVILHPALLEVDPEQNTILRQFLEMGYDLSKVMFIATLTQSSIRH